MIDLFAWVKAFHIMAAIAWMAGLLYLPRLFVYHSKVAEGSESSELFKAMERRLARAIMAPAMGAVWILGLVLLGLIGWESLMTAWFAVKLTAVLGLSAFHGLLMRYLAEFAAGRRPRSERYFRIINEVPAVLMAAIVIMVVVRPW